MHLRELGRWYPITEYIDVILKIPGFVLWGKSGTEVLGSYEVMI